jgi:hypothetical protein
MRSTFCCHSRCWGEMGWNPDRDRAGFGTVILDWTFLRGYANPPVLTEGVMVRICRILEAAAIQAIETAHEHINLPILTDDLAAETLVSISDRRSRRAANWMRAKHGRITFVPEALPLAPRPIGGELLSSWLLRVALANGLTLAQLAEASESRFPEVSLQTTFIDERLSPSARAALSKFLRLAEADVKALELSHRFLLLPSEWILRPVNWLVGSPDQPKGGRGIPSAPYASRKWSARRARPGSEVNGRARCTPIACATACPCWKGARSASSKIPFCRA